jgi:tellurite resistance protein TerC
VSVLLVLELNTSQRGTREDHRRVAPHLMTLLWIAAAIAFTVAIHFRLGHVRMFEFVTGYLIEYALSVDNLFLFMVVFSHFQVPDEQRQRVLFWGILTAIVLRLLFIGAGAVLLRRFHWFEYVLAVVLFATALRVIRGHAQIGDPTNGGITRVFLRLVPSVPRFEGSRFFVRDEGGWRATLLFLALLVIELTDVIFALDSIPAIFAITQDPLIVYTSNILAIAGLRSLFGALASFLERLRYLQHALGAVLLFVAIKLLLHDLIHIPALVSLAVVGGVLPIAVVSSLAHDREP